MAEAGIVIDGTDTDVDSLLDWLRSEADLRGRVRLGSGAIAPGTMGATPELVVGLSAAAGVATALARSLSVWLLQRRSDVTVIVTGPDGRHVAVSARRVADPEKLLLEVLESSPVAGLEESSTDEPA